MILECPACETRFIVNSSLIPAEGREVKCAKCAHQWHVDADPDALPPLDDTLVEPAPEPALSDAPANDIEQMDDSSEEESTEDVSAIDMVDKPEPALESAPAEKDDKPVDVDDDIDVDSFATSTSVPSLQQEPTISFKPFAIAASILFLVLVISSLYAFRPTLQPSLSGLYSVLGVNDTSGLVLADLEMRQRPSRTKARFVVEGSIVNESDEIRELPILRIAIADKAGNWIVSREFEADATLKPGEAYPFKPPTLETAFVDRVDHLVVELGNGVELMLRSE